MKKLYSKEELLEDIRQADQKVEGRLSVEDYKEHGEYSLSPIMTADKARWDSWNEAKEAAGVATSPSWNQKRFSDEEILQSIRDVFEETEGLLTMKMFTEHAHFDSKTAVFRFGNWTKAKEAAGVKQDELDRIFGDWVEYCKEKGYGKIYTDKMEENCINFDYFSVTDFVEWNKKQDNKLTVRGYKVNSNKARGSIFVRVEGETFRTRIFDDYGHLVDEDFHHVFFEMISEGLSPKSVVGAINYLVNDDIGTQHEAADYADCTTVSVRNARDRIFERGFLPEYQ